MRVPRLLVAIVAATLLAGCQTTRPSLHEAEAALPPSDDRLWTSLETAAPGDRFQPLNRGDEAFTWRLRAIDDATASLDLQTFLWLPDSAGRAILGRVLAAADRGVRVRILLDDSFTVGEGDAIAAVAQHPNVQVRIYNPFAVRPDNLALRQVANLGDFARIDHRMHNKVMVVDGRAAIVGGRNLADEYFGMHASANFRDLELLSLGPAVGQLSQAFDRFWNSPWAIPAADVVKPKRGRPDLAALRARLADAETATIPRTVPDEGSPSAVEPGAEQADARLAVWTALATGAIAGEPTVLADEPARVNPARETPDQLAAALVAQLEAARSEIVLVAAYLVPTPELAEALRRAEARGVRVRILTNSLRSNNHTAAHSAYRGFVGTLLAHGVELHETRALAKDRSLYMAPPVDAKHLGLHAKAILIDDDLSFVGSANLDPRSLKLNTELGLLVRSRDLNRRLRADLGVDFDRRNAWHLERSPDGRVRWVGDDQVLDQQPAESTLQRLEDWILGRLPIRDEM
jgi:putative cardiolipin synthase